MLRVGRYHYMQLSCVYLEHHHKHWKLQDYVTVHTINRQYKPQLDHFEMLGASESDNKCRLCCGMQRLKTREVGLSIQSLLRPIFKCACHHWGRVGRTFGLRVKTVSFVSKCHNTALRPQGLWFDRREQFSRLPSCFLLFSSQDAAIAVDIHGHWLVRPTQNYKSPAVTPWLAFRHCPNWNLNTTLFREKENQMGKNP